MPPSPAAKKTRLRWLLTLSPLGLLVIFYAQAELRDRLDHRRTVWEGFRPDHKNFRDLGQSLNQCLGAEVFRPEIIYRANQQFSGWGCEAIGNPEAILTLNHDLKDSRDFYCTEKDGGIRRGVFFNTDFVIEDIENPQMWTHEHIKNTLCSSAEYVLRKTSESKRTLIHCEAGRDRTGAMSALIAAMAGELAQGAGKEQLAEAIECDFEKSSNLNPKHYGRMLRWLSYLDSQGGALRFFTENCNTESEFLVKAAALFLKTPLSEAELEKKIDVLRALRPNPGGLTP